MYQQERTIHFQRYQNLTVAISIISLLFGACLITQIVLLSEKPDTISWVSPIGGLLLCGIFYVMQLVKEYKVTFCRRTNRIQVVHQRLPFLCFNCNNKSQRALTDLSLIHYDFIRKGEPGLGNGGQLQAGEGEAAVGL